MRVQVAAAAEAEAVAATKALVESQAKTTAAKVALAEEVEDEKDLQKDLSRQQAYVQSLEQQNFTVLESVVASLKLLLAETGDDAAASGRVRRAVNRDQVAALLAQAEADLAKAKGDHAANLSAARKTLNALTLEHTAAISRVQAVNQTVRSAELQVAAASRTAAEKNAAKNSTSTLASAAAASSLGRTAAGSDGDGKLDAATLSLVATALFFVIATFVVAVITVVAVTKPPNAVSPRAMITPVPSLHSVLERPAGKEAPHANARVRSKPRGAVTNRVAV